AGAARVVAGKDRRRLRRVPALPSVRAIGNAPAVGRHFGFQGRRMKVAEVPYSLKAIPGGITAPAGFRAAGVAAGIKASGALDVTLIAADGPVAAAGLFTTNQVQAAPVKVSRANLASSAGQAQAIIVNSGCANACTGAEGLAT